MYAFGVSVPEKPREVLLSCTFKLVRRAGRAALMEAEPMREATLGASMRVVEAIVMSWRTSRLEQDVLSEGVDRKRTKQEDRASWEKADSEGREIFSEVVRGKEVKSGSLGQVSCQLPCAFWIPAPESCRK